MIHGAAGGIGAFAVQMAKEKDAYVMGSDMPDKASFLRELKVDQVIDAVGERFEVDSFVEDVGGF